MLARFERLMEQAVEGSLRRVFPTAVQPVQLAKAAARAMEEAQVIGLRGVEVPNNYRIRLAPSDLQRFAGYSGTLASEMRRYLVEYARDRGLRPIAEPTVELVEDDTLRPGSVRADARFIDLPAARRSELDAAIQGTRRLRLADLASVESTATSVGDGGLWLTDRLGLRLRIEPRAGLVRIGRAADNDVAISNQRVSRYHAQLRWVESAWLVYDLGSTNGTFVDQQPVAPERPLALRAGGVLRLGDHELQARAAAPGLDDPQAARLGD